MSTLSGGPNITMGGLVLYLDAANPKSIPLDPVKNLLYTNGVYSPSISNLTVNTTLTTIEPNVKFRISTSAYINPYTFGQIRLSVPLNVLQNGKPYTLSYNYQIISGSLFQMTDWCDESISNVVNINYGSYLYSSATGVRSVYDNTYRFMDFSINSGSIVDIWDIQLVQNTYSPLYTTSSRTTWGDLSGNNNVATLATASISSSIPQYSYLNERVLNFDGTGSYAIVNSNILQDSGGTINMWVYPIGASSGYIFAAVGTNSDRFYINRSNNVISFSRGNPIVSHGKSPAPSGAWYNITLTWDSSNFNSYVNGVYNLTSTYAASGTTSFFTIGGYTFPLGSQGFTGKIATTQIYNRALTAQEVLQNYNSLKSRFGLT